MKYSVCVHSIYTWELGTVFRIEAMTGGRGWGGVNDHIKDFVLPPFPTPKKVL